MAINNPEFKEPGTYPGEAWGWQLITSVKKERIAGFGPEPYRGVENFERWCEFKTQFGESDLIIGFFQDKPEGYEDFETGWDNTVFLWNWPTGNVVTAIFGSNSYEDMATGWTFGSYDRQFDAVSSKPAILSDAGPEDFELGWSENETYIKDFDLVPQDKARFDTGLFTVEHFAIDVWPSDEDEDEEEQSYG